MAPVRCCPFEAYPNDSCLSCRKKISGGNWDWRFVVCRDCLNLIWQHDIDFPESYCNELKFRFKVKLKKMSLCPVCLKSWEVPGIKVFIMRLLGKIGDIEPCPWCILSCGTYPKMSIGEVNKITVMAKTRIRRRVLKNRLESSKKSSQAEPSPTVKRANPLPVHKTENPKDFLHQAEVYCKTQQWDRAITSASEALDIDPNYSAAYMVRALAYRCRGQLNEAVDDYGKVIDLDPQGAEAWKFRGACRAQEAANAQSASVAEGLNEMAYEDYRRAFELKPNDEQCGLALLEHEICLGKYREAVGTTGEMWPRIQAPLNKLICAWLGAIAMILAGRPERRWIHLKEHLENSNETLDPTAWCLAEIEGHLESLESRIDDRGRLDRARMIHGMFRVRFSDKGPALAR